MARKPDSFERQREPIEATLCQLGNALVFMHLVVDRVQAARIINGNDQLLSPTVDDCHRAERLIREAQETIQREWRP
jgi:hypothetical protein